jgi:hypothetical protein
MDDWPAAPGADRRGERRVDVFGDLRSEVMVVQSMTIRQISPSGALVDTAFPLQIDSLHNIRLALGSTSLVLGARVVHCEVFELDPGQLSYRAGLEFVEPGAAAQLAIAEFIDVLKSAEWPGGEVSEP